MTTVRVYGDLLQPNTQIIFWLDRGSYVSGSQYLNDRVIATTDGSGSLEVYLWVNSDIRNSVWRCNLPDGESLSFVLTRNDSNVNIDDLRPEVINPGTGGGNNSVSDAQIGDRTANQLSTPTGNTGRLTQWISWIANRLGAITGESFWYVDPAIDLSTTKARLDSLDTSVASLPSSILVSESINSALVNYVTTNDARLTNDRAPIAGSVTLTSLADTFSLPWAKINKSGSTPADIGAAAVNHNQAWTTIESVPAALIQISTLEPANRYVIVGNGTQFQARQLTISDTPELQSALDQKVSVAGFTTAVRGAIANGAGLLYNQASGVFSLDVSFINQLIENYVNPPITTYALSIESGFALSIEGGRKLLID